METYRAVSACRGCGSNGIVTVLDLGEQALTGVFPKSIEQVVPGGPLTLVWCRDCTLVQLGGDFDSEAMYGINYGYRSGLNGSMVEHLRRTSARLQSQVSTVAGSVLLDIGSNDGTLLQQYVGAGLVRIGIDPTAEKFRGHYREEDLVVADFFSREAFESVTDQKADIITTISMFYDLPDPVDFARQVRDCLSIEGVWYLEQSYMPSMLRTTSYDTICHEHLEYYSLETLQWILREAGLRVLDVRFNRVNGGSFGVTAVRMESSRTADSSLLRWFELQEDRMRFDSPAPFREFESRVFQHRDDLRQIMEAIVDSGRSIVGLGASTKGNVLLQFCGIGPDLLSAIGDVNPDKLGSFTPGTKIPIVSETDARALQPDYFLVLPWHFREGIVQREATFLAEGGGLIFPLPEIEIVQW